MNSTGFQSAKTLLVLFPLLFPVVGRLNAQEPAKPSKPPHVYTNEDLEGTASRYDDELPDIPGLIKCGDDVDCFLRALDGGTPAVVTRTESAEEGAAIVNSNSTWWTTEFTNDRCTVQFRVDDLDARVNEKLMADRPRSARDAIEAKLERMKRDFVSVRGKTETCTVPVRNLKTLMLSTSWTLMSLGPASNFGKNCSGPGFDTPDHSPSKNTN